MNRLIATIAAVLLVPAQPTAAQSLSTSYDAAMAAAMADFNALGATMRQAEAGITQDAMNDPQVQAAYQQYRAAGGWQDFPTWAFNYRATNGYDPNAVRQVYGQQFANTAAEGRAWQGVQDAERASAGAIAGWQGGYAANQAEAGLVLQGHRSYDSPAGGQVPLGYLPSAGPAYDSSTGYSYVPNGDGSYDAYDPNGYGVYVPY